MTTPSQLRTLAKSKLRLRITKRRRQVGSGSFVVTGPDGQLYQTRSKRDALANLAVRLRCFEVPPFKLEYVPPLPPEQFELFGEEVQP